MKAITGFTVVSAIAAIGIIATPVSAKTIWDDIRDTAPRTIWDDIRDTAPRSIWDDIRDTAPVSAPDKDIVGE